MHDSSFGRLLGVLVAPGKTFRSIAERPTWIVPMLLFLVLLTALGYMSQQRVDPEEMARYQLSQMGMDPSDDQVQQTVEQGEKMAPVTQALTPVFMAILFLILGLVFWVAFKLIGSEMDFKSSLATVLHALVPAFGIASVLGILILLGRSSVTPEELMGGGIVASSAAALAPEDASPVVKSLLGSLDVFSIWTVILLIIGYGVVAKVSPKASAITVILLWVLYILGKVGFAAVMGSLGGGAGA